MPVMRVKRQARKAYMALWRARMTRKNSAQSARKGQKMCQGAVKYIESTAEHKNAAWLSPQRRNRIKIPQKRAKSSGRAERMACCFYWRFCRTLSKNAAIRGFKSGVFWCVFCENFKFCVLLISIFWHFLFAPCFLAWFLTIFWRFFVNIIIFTRWIFARFTPFLQKAQQIILWGIYPYFE